MTQSIMTVEEMMADLDSAKPTSTNELQTVEVQRVEDKFLLTQFQLLATPYFVIYLQGKKGARLTNLTDEATEEALLSLAFKEAIFRRVGRNVPQAIYDLLPEIEKNKHKFYTDKDWHKATIISLIEAHTLPLAKETTATRSYPLAAIESYLNALAAYMIAQGYRTVEDWILASTTTKIDIISPDVWDSL